MKINLVIIGVTFFCSNAFSQTDTLNTKPKETTHILQAVNIVANKSKAIKQQPVNISVIEAKPFYNTNATGLDLLRQVSGIKIKQDGGFGARTEIFINGTTGKQIKYFIDGLPQDNMGETQLLNIYPVEQMERIEVYKGVLPVDLGADALGAAINIVTRKEKENYFDASYSIASFNTNRLNFSAKKYISNHFFAGIQLNANYAQNNYSIDAEVPNQFGNNEIVNVKRFHDLYKNYNIKLQTGLTDTRFADQLNLTIIQTGTYDEMQNNLTQTQPYGQAFYKENLLSSILKYQKNNLFKKINVSALLSYNKLHGVFTDTSKNVYNWKGVIVDKKYSGGEITSSGSLLHIYTNVFNGKITSTYAFKDNFKFVFSNTLQHYNRTGKDTVAQKFYGGVDYFGTPSSMLKNIAGIEFEGNLIDSRLKFSTAIKDYYADLSGYTIEWSTQTITEQSLHSMAYNVALAYNINDNTQIKTSYEHAARLPEVEEAFGDLMLIKANPKIDIEKSENVNVNFLHNSNKIETELTGFYRKVSNIIYLRTSQFGGQYQNLLSARVLGAETSIKYNPVDFINLNGNVTYQDLRNQSIIDNSGINNERYKNARLPNIPYLFANAGVSYKKENLFVKKSTLQVWLNTTYTHEYFLYWEVDGAKELKNRIPSQFLQNTGVSYSLADKGLSFAFEVNNITNSKTYDNFKVQLPERAFSFKIRIYKSNTKQK
ncbi:TonB-dependent receptor domain-containing protein [Flavobacterium piscis]|uniref:Outer membrane cobalamin receptor n=1 Tax=Flavobacterium piscis TaxID=1114874 RepID=A0ABU1YB17_9FLAO|nr:TonB-dependent receptor [Flavobacterium piscis]MDR7211430.1 outer membrane cobalamin receptor [Flavobacterium piscis]